MAEIRTKNIVQQYAKELAAAAAILVAAGYLVTSPKEQIAQLSQQITAYNVSQMATDARQDQQLQVLTARAADDKREIQSDLNLLIISQCIVTKSAEVYAQLKCRERIGGRP